jgi:hypothetical protein
MNAGQIIESRPIQERYEEILKKREDMRSLKREEEMKKRIERDPESYGAATHKP